MLESIFLDFLKDKFTLLILCLKSLLILCLDAEVIKRLLCTLNEPVALFKNCETANTSKNCLQLTSLIVPTILELEKIFVQTLS